MPRVRCCVHAQPGPATLLGQRHTCAALHRAAPTVATAATASRLHTRQKQQGLCHPKHTRPSLGPHCLPQGSILQLESCLRFEASVRGDTLGNVPLWSSRLPLQHRLECLACSCHRSGRVRRQGAAVAVGGRTIKEEGRWGGGQAWGMRTAVMGLAEGLSSPFPHCLGGLEALCFGKSFLEAGLWCASSEVVGSGWGPL